MIYSLQLLSTAKMETAMFEISDYLKIDDRHSQKAVRHREWRYCLANVATKNGNPIDMFRVALFRNSTIFYRRRTHFVEIGFWKLVDNEYVKENVITLSYAMYQHLSIFFDEICRDGGVDAPARDWCKKKTTLSWTSSGLVLCQDGTSLTMCYQLAEAVCSRHHIEMWSKGDRSNISSSDSDA